ncbi:MAG TPA: hypothetical protein VG206_13575 [Terriglobia bacterium]|nr:hypothetical protein [Terriglobia bacterium]
MTKIPLNGRSYTDLFATQGGVSPVTTSGVQNSSSGGGFGTVPVAGNDSTGQFLINGQRESANGFYLNGASVQETIGQQAGIVPDLDSISQFRILSSNADAEYGGYSGGLINVVTKSGGTHFHGSLFEFLRNKNLDARGFYSPERPAFLQNHYGGTIGGPIKKDKLFFFGDYQGQRTVQGVETGVVSVPSLADRTGNFSDAVGTLTGSVNGSYLAQTLSKRLGYPVATREPFYTPGCTTGAQCVFPNAVIPQSAFALPATRMPQYIPKPASTRTSSHPGPKSGGLTTTKARCAWMPTRRGMEMCLSTILRTGTISTIPTPAASEVRRSRVPPAPTMRSRMVSIKWSS